MFNLAILAEVTAGAAGLAMLIAMIRRERNLKAPALAVLFFVALNAALIVLALAQAWQAKLIALQVAGFVLLALLGALAWSAAPLFTEKSGRWVMAIVVAAALIGFGLVHIESGLFHLESDSEREWIIVLAPWGKNFFALAILSCVLLIGKFELITAALAWRYGKRGATVAALLLLLICALIAFTSVSLLYGRFSIRFLIGGEFISAIFFLAHLSALRQTPVAPSDADAPQLHATRILSTSVLIYGGLYLIFLGVVVKIVTVLGGDWRQFISFLAALSAIILTLALITGKSVRQRWTRFVERSLLAGSYDFRRELQNLTEAISTAADRDKLLQIVCQTLADIFSSAPCCLLIADEKSSAFQICGINANGQYQADFAALTLSNKQAAWLERMPQSFDVTRLLALLDENKDGEKLRSFLTAGHYRLGAVLFAGQRFSGVIFLGSKRQGGFHSEEDKQLLDVLGNAISISLYCSYLQQHILESRQMESIYRLASFMTHDLRNAISSLTLLTQNAKLHLEKKDFRVDFIAALSRVSEEMQSLVQKLSSVKTAGELQHYAECDSAELIYEVLADLPVPETVTLEADIALLPRAVWDKGQIRVVLRNLLLNALEAMPDGGKLTIRASQDHAQVSIAISDTGVGMSQDFIQHRLFKPNQTTKAKGLGIGLYQSREIILAHGGDMQVKSRLGEGTTIELILPCLYEKVVLQEAQNGTAESLSFIKPLASRMNEATM
jgi:putative PEP-CTERM system histidine kinase